MNKKELAVAVSHKAGIPYAAAVAAVNATFGTIAETLVAGEKVQLQDFGTFEVKQRAARTAINPRTKEAIEVPARNVPSFKPSKALKDKL